MLKVNFIRNSIRIFFLLPFAFSCSQASNSEAGSEVRFPLLAECQAEAVSFLESLKPDISFKVKEFDRVLESHPSIVGYVVINSDFETADGLMSIVNRITGDCYPETYTEIPVDSDAGNEILDTIMLLRKIGVDKTAIVLEGDKIKFFYHDVID